MLHSPDPTIVAQAEKPVRGTVSEAGTGRPRAGVKVTLRLWHDRLPDLTATTDAQGRFEIRGARKAKGYELAVGRDVTAGTLGRTVKAPDTPAYEPVTADIAVANGVVLTGSILDGETKKPIPGFVCVGVLADNTFVRDRPEMAAPDCYDNRANADEAGVYRTVVPPGPVLLMAGPTPRANEGDRAYTRYRQLRPDPDYPQYFDKRITGFRSPGGATTVMQGQYCKVLKLDPDRREVAADVVLERAPVFTLKVRGPDGKPAADVMAAGNTARDWMYPTRCDGDTCPVYELDTARPRLVVLYDRKLDLAGSVRLTGGEKEPVVVNLGPLGTVRGKLVDAADRPIANAVVRLSFRDRPAGEIHSLQHGDRRGGGRLVETNAAGEFTVTGVLPGLKFHVYAQKANKDLEPPDWKGGGYEAKPGETVDVGAVKLKAAGGD